MPSWSLSEKFGIPGRISKTMNYTLQARDMFRKLIVSLGVKLESAPRSRTECLAPLVGELLTLREKFRGEKKYEAADAIRQTLEQAEVIVEDTRDGSRWRLKENTNSKKEA